HGAGKRELVEQPNLLRLFVGTQAHAPSASGGGHPPGETDEIWVLETNLDDLPAEGIGYCYDLLFAAGALDVFTVPIHMKKDRPGVLLSVLAPREQIAAIEAVLFRETATFGVRRYPAHRTKLQREACTVNSSWGPIQGKRGWREGHAAVFTPEYEDCARIAR